MLQDISLEVQRGEFVTLLGPSGIGKTTILKIVAGLLAPSSGQVCLGNQDITHVPPYRRDIGMVFQSYALFPHLSVFENVAFSLRERGHSKREIERKVGDALALVALSDYRNYHPSHLSGGQQQRVALARALVFEPRVVLMDEPLSALDRQLREEMQSEIKRICNERSATVLYVTHDQSEALALSDKIAILHQGKIEQYDSPANIYNNPATAFIAKFLGESSVLAGRLAEINGNETSILLHSGQYIRSNKVLCKEQGLEVEVIIRPEKVKIVEQYELRGSALDATVTSAVFLGDETRYRLDAGGQNILMKQLNHRPDGTLSPGQRVRIGWDVSDVHVFPRA